MANFGQEDNQANLNYKFYKSQFKLVQRILIEKNNYEKILNLGDIYKKDKNEFRKLVKRHKAEKNKSITTQTSSLIEFEKFYSNLFSHDDVEENESHKIVHDEVNNYYENIKEKNLN
jgi:hypothetical protein